MFQRPRKDESIGFAFSGGGARSAVQAGAVRALTEAGIWPSVVAGTSAGAVNAAWLALYPDRLNRLFEIWLRLRMKDVFPGGRVRILANMARWGYVHDASMWEQALVRDVGDVLFEETKIPLVVTAVRLSDGQRVLFDSGPIIPALMASTAIPGVFPPYRIGDELYIDGGVLDYLPVEAVVERGATTIFALDCSWFPERFREGASVVDRAGLIASTEAAREATSLQSTRGNVVHLLRPPTPVLIDGRDFSKSAELLEVGYQYARKYLRERDMIRGEQEIVG